MQLPFTKEEFLNVFKAYNSAVWPLQVFFYLLAFAAIYFTMIKTKRSDKIISLILGFLWLWMGAVYHLVFFTAINKAAYLFGSIFILESFLFLFYGVYRSGLSFQLNKERKGIAGIVLIIFSLIIYPLAGYALDHPYPYNPSFGLPCPTTIFTFGLLLSTNKRQPAGIFIVPVIWSLIGFSAALSLGIYEDTGLLISGLVAILLPLMERKRTNRQDVSIAAYNGRRGI